MTSRGWKWIFIVPEGNGRLIVMEAKATRSIRPDMGASLNRLGRAVSRYKVDKYVIHLPPAKGTGKELTTLSPGIKAIPVTGINTIWQK